MSNAFRTAIAQALTAERERQLMSKRALARRLGVAPTYIVQWEQGKGMSPESILAAEWALGLAPGSLFVQAAEVVRPLVEKETAARAEGVVTLGYAIGALDLVGCTPTPLAGDPHPPIERPEIHLPHAA